MIRVSTQLTDRTAQAKARYKEASRKAMVAAADVYEREVSRAHEDHYTSRNFRETLGVRQSIRRDEPRWTPRGWDVEIGTKLPQPLYWELGHMNLFTRKYERRRIWVPTLIAQTQAIRAAFARVVARMMANG